MVPRTGWAVGAGIEVAVWSNWTAQLEYLYTQFGTRSVYFPAAAQTFDSNLNIQSIRLGFNYRIGGNAILIPRLFTKGIPR